MAQNLFYLRYLVKSIENYKGDADGLTELYVKYYAEHASLLDKAFSKVVESKNDIINPYEAYSAQKEKFQSNKETRSETRKSLP